MPSLLPRKISSVVFLLGMVATVLGCGEKGPRLAPVSGTVTLDGKPLAKVIVTFVPVEGGVSSSGVTDESGSYSLACSLGPGAVVGKHRVYVQSQAPSASAEVKIPDEDDPGYQPDPYASLRAPQFVEKIPARYNKDSQLTQDVQPGTNRIDLELQSTP